jgi:hypothetical protein
MSEKPIDLNKVRENRKFRKEFSDFMENSGYEQADPVEQFARGIDRRPHKHYDCGGDIKKLAPGILYCRSGLCLKCGKKGAARPARDEYGDLYEILEEGTEQNYFECEDGHRDYGPFLEYGKLLVLFGDEPELMTEEEIIAAWLADVKSAISKILSESEFDLDSDTERDILAFVESKLRESES